ncbi:MAG: hypothetical protein JWO38_7482 [Gemmataceae bacterium]|nr:hypothetical protein [Gemmataceae bacterium]
MNTTTEERMTAEEFVAKYGHLSGVELVRGKVVWPGREPEPRSGSHMPRFKHGVVSYRAVRVLSDFVEANHLGWVAINDTFVRTVNDPDEGTTVRGADVLFVSYARLPQGKTPDDLAIPPDLVIEVRSPTDRWIDLMGKAVEYLKAGVPVVVILDPVTATASVYRDDAAQQIFKTGDTLTLPDVLPGFSVPVARLFEG